jgi:PAS domain S-box-containing protein/TyrR family helix-turn-helix protein
MQETSMPSLFQNKIKLNNDLFQLLQNISIVGGIAIDKQGTILCAQGIANKNLGIESGLLLENAMPQLWPKAKRTLEDLTRRREDFLSVRPGTNYVVCIEPILQNQDCDGVFCFFLESGEIKEIFNQLDKFQDLTRELNTIIDSSADGLWVCDAKGSIIRVNPASERICDVKAQDVIGCNTQELIDQGLIQRSVFEEVMKSKKVVSQLTQSRNGRKFIATGTPVFDDFGKIVRVVVSERDVTEIDRLQRELEEQEAIKDRFRNKIIEIQQEKLESRHVIAKSPCMLKALNQAIRISEVDSSVLILGETGVGKELFADLIQRNSSRSNKPMIKINCGAIPESLIEAELFGYEKGAFTDAHASKPGHFELADGVILFLDEIGELPLPAQVKLLRFLEDGQIMRIGATTNRTLDVRIISATHRNIEEMVEQRQFRHDLYYRLNIIPLYIPSLRERKDCILPLIRYFLDYFMKKTGYKRHLSLAATNALLSYEFPGNVRQLINICERLVVMSETGRIDLMDLPREIRGPREEHEPSAAEFHEGMTLAKALERVEKTILARAYAKYRNQYKMADFLGVTQATIARKLKKYGIKKYADLD